MRICSNNNVDIENCFNEYFASIFTHDNNDDRNLEEHSIVDPDVVLENITLTNDEVITVLSNLNNNKAHGSDGVPARLLTEHHLRSLLSFAPSSTNRYNVMFFLMTGSQRMSYQFTSGIRDPTLRTTVQYRYFPCRALKCSSVVFSKT